jgi:hypothetical protein
MIEVPQPTYTPAPERIEIFTSLREHGHSTSLER